jgi:hypothetical protein
MNNDWRQIALRWLGRFSFSFLVIGFFLAWEGYKRYTAANAQAGDWRTTLYFIGAMASVALGFTGLRERHRR